MAEKRLPVGVQSFERIREKNLAYADKTDMVWELTQYQSVFLSRPRRFGKSLFLDTLKCYYLGKKHLFEGTKLMQLVPQKMRDEEWDKHEVLHLDFGKGAYINSTETLVNVLNSTCSTWEKTYGIESETDDIAIRFSNIITAARNYSNRKVVVLIDEYDKPLLDVAELGVNVEHMGQTISLEEYNRRQLYAIFAVLKTQHADLELVFVTGVTKFSQVTLFSGANQLQDISMANKFATICGFSKDELQSVFAEHIKEFADSLAISSEQLLLKLKERYDGYHFSKAMQDIYNPFCLLNSLDMQNLENYWFKSGNPELLVRLLSNQPAGIMEFTGKWYNSTQFMDEKYTPNTLLPLLYQSGYLTIKDYDKEVEQYLLDFPNREVQVALMSLLGNKYFYADEHSHLLQSWINQLVNALRKGECDSVRSIFEAFLASIPKSMRRRKGYTTELFFHQTFYIVFRVATNYMVYTEKLLANGIVDCIVEASDFVYVFEFKLNGTAAQALKQIDDNGYAEPYKTSTKTVYKIGCGFDGKKGNIKDWQVVPMLK